MATTKSGKKIGMKEELSEITENISFLCAFIGDLNKLLKRNRRKEILSYLYLAEKPVEFNELNIYFKDISRTSLYENLEKLKAHKLVQKSTTRPVEYEVTEFAKYLLNLPEEQKNQPTILDTHTNKNGNENKKLTA